MAPVVSGTIASSRSSREGVAPATQVDQTLQPFSSEPFGFLEFAGFSFASHPPAVSDRVTVFRIAVPELE